MQIFEDSLFQLVSDSWSIMEHNNRKPKSNPLNYKDQRNQLNKTGCILKKHPVSFHL